MYLTIRREVNGIIADDLIFHIICFIPPIPSLYNKYVSIAWQK